MFRCFWILCCLLWFGGGLTWLCLCRLLWLVYAVVAFGFYWLLRDSCWKLFVLGWRVVWFGFGFVFDWRCLTVLVLPVRFGG